MLHLAEPTPDAWAVRAADHMDTLLLDHAHCEKKAASTAINLIFRYQDRASLMRPLSELAREELRHFEAVLDLLEERGLPFCPLEPSAYARRLHGQVRRAEPERLLDTLLCCALIEARSCERMKLLSERLPDPQLAAFYGELLASEARHFTMYCDLAGELCGHEAARARLPQLAAHEAEVLRTAVVEPRLHSRL